MGIDLPEQADGAEVSTDLIGAAASSGLLDTVIGGVPMAMALVDANLRVVRANAGLAAIVGRPVDALSGLSIGEVMPDQAGVIAPAVEEVLATGEPVRRMELSSPGPDEERHWQFSAHAVSDRGGDMLGVGVFLVDVTSEHQAARELIDRARRLAAVASLGQRALAGRALPALLDDAVRLVTATVGVEVAQAFELLPGDVLLLRAAAGVPDDLVGVAIVDAGRGSQSGYTLLTRAPAITEDLTRDTRFKRPAHAIALGLRSGITVVVGGPAAQPWGVLAAHAVRTRAFSTDDVHFLELVANVLGVAIQRQQAEDELRASHARVDLSLRAGGLVSWQWDIEADTLTWDGDVEGVIGIPLAELGTTYSAFLDRISPADVPTVVAAVEGAVQDREEHQFVASLIDPPGAPERWLEISGRLIGGEGGVPARLVGVAADITQRRLADQLKASMLEGEHRARLEAERARERLTLLAEAGDSLGASLDPIATLRSLARLVLPAFCDAVMVYSIDEGELLEVELTHRDAEQAERLREIRQHRHKAGGDGIWSARRAIRTGRSEMLAEITDDMLVDAAAGDDSHLERLRVFDPVSAISLPLVARGRVVGALCLVRTGSALRYDADDLVLVEELAGRAGLAVDNGRLFESRSAVARTLQESLLPPAMPDIPGVDVATRYRVAGGDIEIGGDFYDLFEMGDESWSVIVGDVCGKGPEAAALTGLFRHTVRAAAVRQRKPSQILRFTNSVIIDQIDDTRFCTAAMLRVRPADDSVEVSASSAGHPLPLVVRAAGTVERVMVQGTLIGVVPEPTLTDADVILGPGDSIVLYTDGVTEARRGKALFGEPRLCDVLRTGARGLGASAIAELIERAVEEFQGGPGNDDLAVLVVQARRAVTG